MPTTTRSSCGPKRKRFAEARRRHVPEGECIKPPWAWRTLGPYIVKSTDLADWKDDEPAIKLPKLAPCVAQGMGLALVQAAILAISTRLPADMPRLMIAAAALTGIAVLAGVAATSPHGPEMRRFVPLNTFGLLPPFSAVFFLVELGAWAHRHAHGGRWHDPAWEPALVRQAYDAELERFDRLRTDARKRFEHTLRLHRRTLDANRVHGPAHRPEGPEAAVEHFAAEGKEALAEIDRLYAFVKWFVNPSHRSAEKPPPKPETKDRRRAELARCARAFLRHVAELEKMPEPVLERPAEPARAAAS